MFQVLLRALAIAGPVAIGFLSSDLLKWVQSIPLIGSFFKADDSGNIAPWKIAVAIIGGVAVILFILKKLKIKI